MDHRVKKILIFHTEAGHGHKKAAIAIEQAVRAVDPLISVHTYDALDFFPGWVKSIYVGSYVFMMKKMHWMWGFLYWMSDNKAWYPITAFKRRIFNGFFGKRLADKICQVNPDVVISTHFMPPEVCAHLKKQGRLKADCITVVTDMLVHRFWIHQNTDKYFVATTKTRQALIAEGIDPQKIYVTGIPIELKFSKNQTQGEARQFLHIPRNKFTALFTSGGFGAGDVMDLVQDFCSDSTVQAMVVCGNNEQLKHEMDLMAIDLPNLIPYGFVNNMDVLMDAADVVVGKAGGLTTSESLAKGKPMFILSPLPGQEVGNTVVLTSANAAFWVKSKKRLKPMIQLYREDKDLQAQTQRAIQTVAKPHAANEIVKLVISHL